MSDTVRNALIAAGAQPAQASQAAEVLAEYGIVTIADLRKLTPRDYARMPIVCGRKTLPMVLRLRRSQPDNRLPTSGAK